MATLDEVAAFVRKASLKYVDDAIRYGMSVTNPDAALDWQRKQSLADNGANQTTALAGPARLADLPIKKGDPNRNTSLAIS